MVFRLLILSNCFMLIHCVVTVIEKPKGDIISVLKADKEDLESSLNKEKQHALQFNQELTEAESRNTDL